MHIHAMISLKQRRQDALADLISSGASASQEELVERLAELGFTATQATISRDLEQIGAIRARRDGRPAYALPEATPAAGSRLTVVIREWVQSVTAAGNLVVVKTPPGSAHLVGVVLDEANLAQVVGTICGDDTIFVACTGARTASQLSAQLQSGIS
jgi:transcriptional regulator of arginine metabolism